MRPERWLYTIPLRLRSLFRRDAVEAELGAELQDHLERKAREYVAGGLTPTEARRKALKEFGGVELSKENCRDTRRVRIIETTLQDIHFGLRMLRKNPGFTAVAVLTLALGIGANTAIFSSINALVLRPLPVPKPENLVSLGYTEEGESGEYFSFPLFEKMRDALPRDSFESVSAIRSIWRSNVTTDEGAGATPGEDALVDLVSGNYFSTLGANPAIGRALTPDDDRMPGSEPLVVISHAYWKRRFALAPNVVGQRVVVNGTPYTIIGVMSPSFSGDWVGRPTDLWIPAAMQAQVYPERPDALTNPNMTATRVIARLRPGAKFSAAQAAAEVVWRQGISALTPMLNDSWKMYYARQRFHLESYANGYSPERAVLTQPLTILLTVASVVLLVACVNIANLLLARAAARKKEITVRVALGASAGRIARHVLTESLLLASLGGVAGIIVALWGTQVLSRSMAMFAQPTSLGSLRMQFGATLDLRALLFTAAVCVVIGTLFGLAPVFRAREFSLGSKLRQSHSAGSGRGGVSLGKSLLVAQEALTVLLLIGAGLFIRTLHNLASQDLGFDRHHVLFVWTQPGQSRRGGPELANFWVAAEERISSIPGVISAAGSMKGLLRDQPYGAKVKVPGYVSQSDPDYSPIDLVAPRFFATVGMRLVRGRDFTERDTENAPHVAVLNEYAARMYFGAENPVGRHIGIGKGGLEAPFEDTEVVGVVHDAKGYNSLRETERRMIFLPYRQDQSFQSHPRLANLCLAVRTEGAPERMKAAIRTELAGLDPNLPVMGIDSVEEQMGEALVEERVIAASSAFFGALAVVLACVGVYGLVSYSVARRTHEIGIRMALGARARDVVWLVIREALKPTSLGAALGLAVAFGLTRMTSRLLFGVGATDPSIFAFVGVLLIAVALLAGLVPAGRATRIDPMIALRYE